MNPPKRLLVTGASGFVAGSVLAQAGPDWELHAVSRGEAPAPLPNLRWHSCDPADPKQLAHCFQQIDPDIVIHTAALADIDFCQTHPEMAKTANVEVSHSLVELCRQSQVRMIFCSTDTVFDGEHAPYAENAPPGPVNYYAETKVAGEQLVAGLGADAVIARLSLVVGLPVLGAGNSFLARMLTALQAGRTVVVPEHEVRTPVDVITVGRALLELAAGVHTGIIHLAGHDRINRLAMAQRIAAHFGFSSSLIQPQPATAMVGRAARPRDVSLLNAKAGTQLKTPMRTLQEGLSLIQKMSEHLPA